MSSPTVGIDIGTSTCLVAVCLNGKVEIIANDQGNRTTPSYVAFTDSEIIRGEAAKSQVLVNSANTIFDVPRLVGRRFSDPTLAADIRTWPFKVVESSTGNVAVEVAYKEQSKIFTGEEVYALLLTKMKQTAEAYLGKAVSKAVVTCPAYFSDFQRDAITDAGKIAGLDILEVLNEPTAAAMAYGLERTPGTKKIVLVYDLGGGSLDVTVLLLNGEIVEVLGTAGDAHLGGEDFDNRLVQHFAKEFQRKHKKDITGNSRSLRRLRNACELAKRTLSTLNQSSLEIDSLFEGTDFFSSIPRVVLEDLCWDLFQTTIRSVEQALKDSKVDRSQVTDIVLAGGCSRIPKIQSLLQEFFGGKLVHKTITGDEVVAFGAALYDADIAPSVDDGGVSIKLPKGVLLLSIGIELNDGRFVPVIQKGSPFPAEGTVAIHSGTPSQTANVLKIYEGERSKASQNHFVGLVDLTPLMSTKEAEFDVSMSIDAKGHLSITASSIDGDEDDVQVQLKKERLSDQKVHQMLEEAEKFAAEDEDYTENATSKSALSGLMVNALQLLSDSAFNPKIVDSDRDLLTTKCSELASWLEDEKVFDQDVCLAKQKELELVVRDVIDRVYEADQEALSGLVKSYAPDRRRRRED